MIGTTSHNLMYAIANLMEEGKLKQATALSAKLTGARGELESTLYINSPRDSISRLDPRLPVALRTANWAQVMQLAKTGAPPAGRPNLAFLAGQLDRFAAGMQAIELHDLQTAEETSARFDAELWRISRPSKDEPVGKAALGSNAANGLPKLPVLPDALLEPLLNTFSVMSIELRASLLTAQGKTSDAKSLFARAAAEEKSLGYREPPIYIRPVAETEGAAMMAASAWTDAKSGYERALLARPKSGLALYGIAMSSEKLGDWEAAGKDYRAFLNAWKDADSDLAQVTHARTYLAGPGSVARELASRAPFTVRAQCFPTYSSIPHAHPPNERAATKP